MFRVLLSCKQNRAGVSEQTAWEMQQVVTAALEGLAAILLSPGSVTQPSLGEHSNQTNHKGVNLSLPLVLGVSVTQGHRIAILSGLLNSLNQSTDQHITHARRTAEQRPRQGSMANTSNHST